MVILIVSLGIFTLTGCNDVDVTKINAEYKRDPKTGKVKTVKVNNKTKNELIDSALDWVIHGDDNLNVTNEE